MSDGVDGGAEAVIQVSVVSNPLPVIVTAVLIGPKDGFRVIVGPVTVNVAEAESRVIPTTVTVCAPMYGFTLATMNEALNVPPLIVHDGAETVMSGPGVLERVHAPLSPGLANPLPVMETTAPRGPDAGLRVIVGAA
jgi:hypothetical protein